MYSEDVVTRGRLKSLVIHLCGFLAASIPFSGFALTSITAAWDPNSGPNVTGYKVYYGAATGTYTNSVSVGNTTTATLSGLVEGSTYYLSATALDNLGQESDFSAEIAYVVPFPPSNQPPTLNAIANISINENASAQTVNLTGITSGATNESQTLTVTASSSNPALIPTPTVSYTSPNTTGSISFAPLGLGFGSSTITVTVNDGGASNNVVSRSFIVTVTPVNQAPTLNAIANVTVIENSGAQTVNLSGISSGATNEAQTLTVTAVSSNTAVVANPTVTYTSPNATGTLTFTPKANAWGTAAITVTVNDGGASNNIVSRTFNIVVDAPPTISSISNRTIPEDSTTSAIAFTVGDAESTASSLITTATSSNQSLVPDSSVILGGSGANRTVTIAPVIGQAGIATITLTVSDGIATSSTSFQLSVQGKPTPPANLHVVSQ